MAVEIFFKKMYDSLVPADKAQLELMERLKPGGEYKAVLTQPRNIGFHRKAFALANLAFEHWSPPADKEYNGLPILKNFDFFRDELTILSGFYDVVWTIGGKMKLVPHSWSWGAADQEKFERMYSAFIDVILRDILTTYTKEDVDRVVAEVLRFAS